MVIKIKTQIRAALSAVLVAGLLLSGSTQAITFASVKGQIQEKFTSLSQYIQTHKKQAFTATAGIGLIIAGLVGWIVFKKFRNKNLIPLNQLQNNDDLKKDDSDDEIIINSIPQSNEQLRQQNDHDLMNSLSNIQPIETNDNNNKNSQSTLIHEPIVGWDKAEVKLAQMSYKDIQPLILTNKKYFDTVLEVPIGYEVNNGTITLGFSNQDSVVVDDDSVFLMPKTEKDSKSAPHALIFVKSVDGKRVCYQFIPTSSIENALKDPFCYRLEFNNNCLCGGCKEKSLWDYNPFAQKTQTPNIIGYWRELTNTAKEGIISLAPIRYNKQAKQYVTAENKVLECGKQYYIFNDSKTVQVRVDEHHRLRFFDPFHSEWLNTDLFVKRYPQAQLRIGSDLGGNPSYQFYTFGLVFDENIK